MKRQATLAKDLTRSKQKLARRQKGRCPECGQSLFNDEEIQVHHLLARSQGGKDSYRNLALVHLLCHQHIHAMAQRAMKECQHSDDQELSAHEDEGAQQAEQNEKKELCRS
jgi:RNA-directed DNA polymerase